ncbi:polysaccharide biosynthesis/export family protein [Caulobacter sp.]
MKVTEDTMNRKLLITTVCGILMASGSSAWAQDSAATAPSPAVTSAGSVSSDYVLGPGDKMRVIVFGEDTLSGQFVVADNGLVAMPLIGVVPAAGKSVQDFQKRIEALLVDGYLRDPRVSVEVLTFRPFYILGEVNKPGEYPYTNDLNVVNAIAKAGGFTYRANTKRAFVRRSGEAKEQQYGLDSKLTISPGDTVRIGERLF